MPDLKQHRLQHTQETDGPEVVPEAPKPSGSMDSLIVLVVGALVVYAVYWGLGSAGVAPRYQIIAVVLLGLMLVRDVIRQARERRKRPPGPTDYRSALRR